MHPADRESFDEVAIFVVAHADDWQLFMHPAAFNSLQKPRCKTVIITTTAGDAGMPPSFWQAREAGALSSIRFCLAPLHYATSIAHTQPLFYPNLVACDVLPTCSAYWLRLPDGGLDGEGFAVNHFATMHRLQAGQLSVLSSVDGRAHYHHWADLVRTVQAIIDDACAGIGKRSIHYPDPDAAHNPEDHPDHQATGALVQELQYLPGMEAYRYVGYSSKHQQASLSTAELFWKAAMLAAYEKAVYDATGYSTLAENPDLYVQWCGAATQGYAS